jgi:GlpG protein
VLDPAECGAYSDYELDATMRRIGQLSDQTHAERLRDYLAGRGVQLHVEQQDGVWQIWALDEDRLAEARQELAEFSTQPEVERYRQGAAEERARKAAELDAALSDRREQIVERRKRPRGPIRGAPITFLVIVLCGVVTALTRFGEDEPMLRRLIISNYIPMQWTAALPEVREGQFWRLITPCFIHFDVLHLLGNASWMYLFGRVIEQTRTRTRFVTLLLLIALGSNIAQYFVAGPMFGGLSGVDCGLFGYLWFKTHFRPEAGFALAPDQTIFFAGWMIICLTGLAGPIANTAHIAGMILGMLLALPRSVPVFR